MYSNKMDDRGTDALKAHLAQASTVDVRQTRRGWLQECLGCEARTEMKYFTNNTQFAESLEDSDFCARCWCQPCYGFTAQVKEVNTGSEVLTVARPCAWCACCCKCCCYQQMTVTSGGQSLGQVKEDCYYCVASMTAYDASGNPLYKIHQPTCCGGICVNCCTEGNPCFGRGCCKEPFHVFPADATNTNGQQPYIAKILKRPKSWSTEVFTDAESFEVTFPERATVSEKGLLVGTAVFLNALFFEGDNQNGGGGGGGDY